ncbi:MAG: phage holin family protein [Clostridia bacterium]|nr:phage holin family protein [Clostridia bacterium]
MQKPDYKNYNITEEEFAEHERQLARLEKAKKKSRNIFCAVMYVVTAFLYGFVALFAVIAASGTSDSSYTFVIILFVVLGSGLLIVTILANVGKIDVSKATGKPAFYSLELAKKCKPYEDALSDYRDVIRETNRDYWTSLKKSDFDVKFSAVLRASGFREAEVTFPKGSDGRIKSHRLILKDGKVSCLHVSTSKKDMRVDVENFLASIPKDFPVTSAVYLSVCGYDFDKGGAISKALLKLSKSMGLSLELWDISDMLFLAYGAGALIFDMREIPLILSMDTRDAKPRVPSANAVSGEKIHDAVFGDGEVMSVDKVSGAVTAKFSYGNGNEVKVVFLDGWE